MPETTINSTILGAAAEHYVMCQLLRRGMIAALAPAGVPDADIIVSNRLGSALAAVQVKARRAIGSDGGWHMKAKHEGMIRPLLFYAFVDFGKTLDDPPRSWLIPSAIVAAAIAESHSTWLRTLGRGGRPHHDTEMRRLMPSYSHQEINSRGLGWLDPYREGWGLIVQAAEAL